MLTQERIASAGPFITEKEIEYVNDAVTNGWYAHWGDYLEKFEGAFAEYVGTKYSLATSSCTGALHIAMSALGVGPGDEVIVPEITWIASATSIVYLGAAPVFADVETDSWCIDPESVRKLITPKTKGIVPVHLFGQPANMEEITKIAQEHGLFILEDAAPGLGSTYKGKKVGAIGDMGAFSFQGAKLLVTGEGGMLVTNNPELYEKARLFWDHGRDSNSPEPLWNIAIGYKYKMANILAALGLAQLERIDDLIGRKNNIFAWYKRGLGNLDGIQLNMVPNPEIIQKTYYMSCMIMTKKFKLSRDELIKYLKDNGIDCRPMFHPITKFPIFPKQNNSNPNAYFIAENGIVLPTPMDLTEEAAERVCDVIKEAML